LALYLDYIAVEISSALAKSGIRSILLKGASFRTWLYDAGEVRWYSDVDLLVKPAEAGAAARVLERLGYRDVFAGASPTETSAYATEYRSDRVIVDLHRSLLGITVTPDDAWRVLESATTAMTLNGVQVEALTIPARCFHIALDAANSGPAPSKAAQELQRALDRTTLGDWRGALELADRLGASASLVVGLGVVPDGHGIIRELAVTPTIPTDVALRAAGSPPVARGLNALMSARGMARLRLLARELVPTPAGLRYWSPMARRGTLGMVAAYAYRPLYLLVRAPVAVAAVLRVRRNHGGRSSTAR